MRIHTSRASQSFTPLFGSINPYIPSPPGYLAIIDTDGDVVIASVSAAFPAGTRCVSGVYAGYSIGGWGVGAVLYLDGTEIPLTRMFTGECNLGTDPPEACVYTQATVAVTDGPHTFELRAWTDGPGPTYTDGVLIYKDAVLHRVSQGSLLIY